MHENSGALNLLIPIGLPACIKKPAAMLPTLEFTTDTPAEHTATVSSVHIARGDMNCIHQNGWMLPFRVTADRIWLSLGAESNDHKSDFARQLTECGFSMAFANLVESARNKGKRWLLIDSNAEPDDRLPIFVG